MNKVFLLLGANIGDPPSQLAQALQEIQDQVGKIEACSSIYKSEAWGVTEQPTFLNQVVLVSTPLPPISVLDCIQSIENRLGRLRLTKWGARVIDIDILYFNKINRSEEHTSELQSRENLVCRLLLQISSCHLYLRSFPTRRSSDLAWGVTEQPTFLNQVVLVSTPLPPISVLDCIQSIENRLGRLRLTKWGARVIDIDILYFNKINIHHERLIVPHPHLPERRFVLVPLVEIAPAFVHPELGMTTTDLLAQCKDPLIVQPYTQQSDDALQID